MPNYRRARVEGATYFFTVTLADRRQRLLTDHADVLRQAFRDTKASLPFAIDAVVILPDHLHCIWTLPAGDSDFSSRWRRIKSDFSKAVSSSPNPPSLHARTAERGIWQPRFWEHVIRDDRDYTAHLDYIHFNPVKHGHARRAADWPFSSFHRYVRMGVYPVEWADGEERTGSFGEAV